MVASAALPWLPYHEPAVAIILVQTTFLLLLNVINVSLDRIIYCGLLGQVLVGIAWGTPGAKWLSTQMEEVIVQLGYLGLILLVFQGGLSTQFSSLKANFLLSSAVASTGIIVPIALSFSLQELVGATPLQAFAAGAALCSTSLGTTFTVLASSGLSSSRLGVVLTSAAMMDDVVGLVLVQVISNLGGNFNAMTVVRPILVSVAFAVFVPIACSFVLKPATVSLYRYRAAHPTARLSKVFELQHTAFAMHSALLIALVAGASYAGTSNLFAAYIAGTTISWWDTEVSHYASQTTTKQANSAQGKTSRPIPPPSEECLSKQTRSARSGGIHAIAEADAVARTVRAQNLVPSPHDGTSGKIVYERYYQQPALRILQPFFFASIGFSIPITRMFSRDIVWRGIVYAILMTFGKLVCGIWLVRFPLRSVMNSMQAVMSKVKLPCTPYFGNRRSMLGKTDRITNQEQWEGASANVHEPAASAKRKATPCPNQTPSPAHPLSLQPSLILALAMTARGEIGFLISAVAESGGVFASASDAGPESSIFLVVTWAIVLCTMIGPLGVGLCVRRVRALEKRKEREQEGAGKDVLGVWGVDS